MNDDQITAEAVHRKRRRQSLATVAYERTGIGTCDLCGLHCIQQDASWVSRSSVPGWDDSCYSKVKEAKDE